MGESQKNALINMIKIMNMNKRTLWTILLIAGVCFIISSCKTVAQELPAQTEVLEKLRLANQYFMDKWPDVGQRLITDRSRPSNIWTKAVYYEGLMDLYEIDPNPKFLKYAVDWGEFHDWNLRNGDTYTRNADNQCAGQTYIELYQIDPQPERIAYIKESIDSMMRTDKVDDWDWIDAIQMGMPIFAQLGSLYEDNNYYERAYEMYEFSKNKHGDNGLYNEEDDLWWRDADFDPSYQEPNGEDCYWSRGNGWVVMALCRVLERIPADEPHRKEYETDLINMLDALVKVQREDGFWNVSLHDPNHFGGPETSGTAMFVYGIAWAINHGLVAEEDYRMPLVKGWNAIHQTSIQDNGFLGFVQSTGKEPKDGQPLSINKIPDFEDFGLGAVLMAGVEVYKLLDK